MPVPKPHKGESQDDFMGRCMSALADSDPDRPQEQRLAMCFSAWREEHGGEPPKKSKQVDDEDVPEPDDESEDDFIDRCTDEGWRPTARLAPAAGAARARRSASGTVTAS